MTEEEKQRGYALQRALDQGKVQIGRNINCRYCGSTHEDITPEECAATWDESR